MRRLHVQLAGLTALAVVLGTVGFVCGVDLAMAKALRYVDEVAITDPRQPRGIQLTTAALFAWPAIAAAIACGVHRWRRGEAASLRAVAAYLAIPAVVVGAMHVARWLFFPMPPASGIRPVLTLTAFAPSTSDAQLAVFVAIVTCLYIGVRARTMKG